MYEIKDIKKLLSHEFGSDFEILEEKSKPLTAAGEHYGSIMIAIDLTIVKNGLKIKLNLVGKFLPASEMLRIAFDTNVTFRKEVVAYMEVIPALLQFQKEHGFNYNQLLDMFPKCYGARVNLDKNQNSVGEDAVLLFENLKLQGYVMYDRFKGFDYDSTKLIMKDLAKFHGTSLAMKLLKPKQFHDIFEPCLTRYRGLDDPPQELEDAFDHSVITVCKSIPEISQYTERLAKVFNESKKWFRSDKYPRPAWGSLVHGDYWGNNTMVKYDPTGKPIKNKIVDLQIILYDSIVHDILFFLFTSVNSNVLNERYYDLIRCYHNQLLDTLSDYNIDKKPYKWDEFLTEIDNEAPKEAFHILFMIKFIYAEKGKVKSLEEFQPSDWTSKDLIGERHHQKLKHTVLEFVRHKWI